MVNSKNDIVKNYILDQIEKSIYCEGQLIESEIRLCTLLNISRMTVRKALDELASEGIIFKEKGRGTFVAKKPKFSEFQCGVGFTQEVLKRGMIPSSKEVTLNLVEADKEISSKLGIEEHEKVWEVKRIRCANDTPVISVKEYYLYKLCPDLTLTIAQHSIYEHLEKKAVTFAFADQKLAAVRCSAAMSKQLHVKENHPLIMLESIVYMKNGTIFNYGIEYYCTDHFNIMQSVYNH